MQTGCTISSQHFGNAEGQELTLFKLSNGEIEVLITNYGATITGIFTPDKNNGLSNIVAGLENASDYMGDHPYLGCVVGRYANRIAFGTFLLDGKRYTLPLNDDVNHLHGGFQGFNRQVWKVEDFNQQSDRTSLVLAYLSKDGEEGYPGNLRVSVAYELTTGNRLHIRYLASTDKATILNLTNHSYFNLTGFENSTIYDHYLHVHAEAFTAKNTNNVPDGTIVTVKDSPLDFTTFKRIGQDIAELTTDMGYDHNFVLSPRTKSMPAAMLYDMQSGRSLKVFTDRPGAQLYTANWWNGELLGSQHKPYLKHGAVAIETQAFPDSPNHPDFPSTTLRPGETFTSETVFEFSNCWRPPYFKDGETNHPF